MARHTVTRRVPALAAAAAVALGGCGGSDEVKGGAPTAPPADLTVASPVIPPGGAIPADATCAGAGIRPELRFGRVPRAAVELAVLVVDLDAGGFVHWSVYDLDPRVRGLPPDSLPVGAREGRNSAGHPGWTPPCPPVGDQPHRYQFELYWLRERSGLDAGSRPQEVVDAVRAGAGGRGELVGRFARR